MEDTKKYEEFRINGCVATEPLTEDEFFDAFIEMMEAKNWTFGGGLFACVDEDDKFYK